jgi:phage anti-repressor protein
MIEFNFEENLKINENKEITIIQETERIFVTWYEIKYKKTKYSVIIDKLTERKDFVCTADSLFCEEFTNIQELTAKLDKLKIKEKRLKEHNIYPRD